MPSLGAASARGLAGTAVGGDTTFAVDEEAENYAADFLARQNVPVALYSEDRGLLAGEDPDYVLVLDPIDGTRPAAAGFEAACVSIAVARWEKNRPWGMCSTAFWWRSKRVGCSVRAGEVGSGRGTWGAEIGRYGSPPTPTCPGSSGLSVFRAGLPWSCLPFWVG